MKYPSLVLFAAAAALAQTGATPAADILPKADELVNAYMKQNRFSGSVLVAKGGKILVNKGYGFANVELEVPNSPQTKFRLGSITKQFTAAAVLLLEEQGKLGVNDPVSKYYPEAPEAWKDITVHHLLTHTSGLHNYTAVPEYRTRMREKLTPLTLIARFKDLPLDFAPGSKFSYSNSGYALLGYIVEKASGEKYEDYLKKHLFGPTDMQSSGYDWDTTILKNRASGYERSPDGRIRNAEYLDMSQPYSAGSLYSTTEDLYRWDRALYTDKALSAKSKEKLYTPALDNYAYGWFVDKQFNRRRISHGGGINGFTTQLARYPDDDACIVVLNNYGGPATGAIARDLAAILFGEKYTLPVERKEVTLDPATLDRYTGTFQLGPLKMTVTRKGNQLFARPGAQPEAPLLAEAENRFFVRGVDAQLIYSADSSEVTLIQGEATLKGKRVQP